MSYLAKQTNIRSEEKQKKQETVIFAGCNCCADAQHGCESNVVGMTMT